MRKAELQQTIYYSCLPSSYSSANHSQSASQPTSPRDGITRNPNKYPGSAERSNLKLHQRYIHPLCFRTSILVTPYCTRDLTFCPIMLELEAERQGTPPQLRKTRNDPLDPCPQLQPLSLSLSLASLSRVKPAE